MNKSQYISGKRIKARYDVSDSTLKRWAITEKIRTIRVGTSATSKRLYHADDVATMFNDRSDDVVRPPQRDVILYARVSSEHQRADLDRQVTDLSAKYPGAHIIKDVGSGLNFHRRGFTSLLERVCAKSVGTVVVTHRDRLARFAMELVEWICAKHDTKLVVLSNSTDDEHCPEDELRDDLLAVTTFFVARNNGRRSAENKKRRQADSEARKKHKASGEFSEEDSSSADASPAPSADALAQH